MTTLQLAIAALATWRLTHMLTREDGPGDIFKHLRLAAGATVDVQGNWYAERFPGKLLTCFYCASVWVAAVVSLTLGRMPWQGRLQSIFAISGAACLLQRIGRSDQ